MRFFAGTLGCTASTSGTDETHIAYMKHDGADPVGSSPAELAAYFRREVAKYAKLIKTANIQVE